MFCKCLHHKEQYRSVGSLKLTNMDFLHTILSVLEKPFDFYLIQKDLRS
jgi:hypothetical protein